MRGVLKWFCCLNELIRVVGLDETETQRRFACVWSVVCFKLGGDGVIDFGRSKYKGGSVVEVHIERKGRGVGGAGRCRAVRVQPACGGRAARGDERARAQADHHDWRREERAHAA